MPLCSSLRLIDEMVGRHLHCLPLPLFVHFLLSLPQMSPPPPHPPLCAEAIVDIATLTGACMIALGDSVAGLFTPSDEMAASLSAAAKEAGEAGTGAGRSPCHAQAREVVGARGCNLFLQQGRRTTANVDACKASSILPALCWRVNCCICCLPTSQPCRREGVAHAHGGGLRGPAQEVGKHGSAARRCPLGNCSDAWQAVNSQGANTLG